MRTAHTQNRSEKQLLKVWYWWYDLSNTIRKLLGISVRFCAMRFFYWCWLSTQRHACTKTGKTLHCLMVVFCTLLSYWPEFATFGEFIECNAIGRETTEKNARITQLQFCYTLVSMNAIAGVVVVAVVVERVRMYGVHACVYSVIDMNVPLFHHIWKPLYGYLALYIHIVCMCVCVNRQLDLFFPLVFSTVFCLLLLLLLLLLQYGWLLFGNAISSMHCCCCFCCCCRRHHFFFSTRSYIVVITSISLIAFI